MRCLKMLVNMDKVKIIELLKDFNAVTGLRIGLFGLDGEEIASYPVEYSDFCSFIKENEDGAKGCRLCDKAAFEECEQLRGLYIYKCHMGLTEAVFPIVYEGVIIAYIMFGQVFEGTKKEKILQKISNSIEGSLVLMNGGRIERAFRLLPKMSRDKIEAVAKMMEVYASYIRFSDYIYTYIGGIGPLIKSFIEQNIEIPLTIEVISKRLNVGKTTLCVKFKETFHMTINEFITKTRLERAKILLKDKHLNVTQIAERCGFSDSNYFIRIFKKKFGQTPFEYRNFQKS